MADTDDGPEEGKATMNGSALIDESSDPFWCGYCGEPAYLCDRHHGGSATWAIHCRSKPWHNVFSTDASPSSPSPTGEENE